jgi:hypothetical protein
MSPTRTSAPRQLAGQGGRRVTMTDAQVLEARALQDFAGWSRAQIRARYPDIARRTLDGILDGSNRVRLIATRKHLPEGVSPL